MNIAVIGAGFGGLSAAAYLAQAGHTVTVLEKNEAPGGRATVIEKDGFRFDVGPSWYLMPDVYEEFFADFGVTPSDFYELTQLKDHYSVYFDEERIDVRPLPHASSDFESIEQGSGARLTRHLKQTSSEYQRVRNSLLSQDGLALHQFLTPDAFRFVGNPRMIQSFHKRVSRVVGDKRLQKILEFMVVFMGGSPKNIPALYGLLNWIDLGQGVWYPKGGFGAVASAFADVAIGQGVTIKYGADVTSIRKTDNGLAVEWNDEVGVFDKVVANADYQYVETKLLEKDQRSYDERYWERKTLAPSSVIGLIGVNKKLALPHHSLFFDTDWDKSFDEVFDTHQVPNKPLFYLCAPSVSDTTVAPKGMENLFILIPVSNKLNLSPDQSRSLVDSTISRIEAQVGESFSDSIVSKTVLDHSYFKDRFNASAGNAFGLAHTMLQSGPLRPRVRSNKNPNLYYVGQFTNPGTGVPLVILSGKLVAERVIKDIK